MASDIILVGCDVDVTDEEESQSRLPVHALLDRTINLTWHSILRSQFVHNQTSHHLLDIMENQITLQ